MKLNKRKQGISLIVLVITIIVMIIIAAAIILALNSANLTSKTSWAQLSSDRASLQSEYAVILANIIAKEKIADDNYMAFSIEDVRNNPEFQEWCRKVKNTNSLFTIYGDEVTEKATPAEIEVRLKLTTKEIESMGLNIAEGKVKGYDWVKIKLTNPYDEEGWEVAYVCNNGKWEEEPIQKGNKAEGEFVVKFYKQEDEMADLTSVGLTNSNAYHMVIEGNGEMPGVSDIENMIALVWTKPALAWYVDMQTNGSSAKDPGIYAYTTKAIVCDGIENIPNEFFSRSFIKEVITADSVTSLGIWAFSNCHNIVNIMLPDNVISIGDMAFRDCYGLRSIIVPTNVKSIGYETFSNCYSLTNITIPESVTSIGSKAFYNCYTLSDVYYEGTEEDWKKIVIEHSNEDLTSATIHYNSK